MVQNLKLQLPMIFQPLDSSFRTKCTVVSLFQQGSELLPDHLRKEKKYSLTLMSGSSDPLTSLIVFLTASAKLTGPVTSGTSSSLQISQSSVNSLQCSNNVGKLFIHLIRCTITPHGTISATNAIPTKPTKTNPLSTFHEIIIGISQPSARHVIPQSAEITGKCLGELINILPTSTTICHIWSLQRSLCLVTNDKKIYNLENKNPVGSP